MSETYANDAVFERAAIGRVTRIGEEDEVPAQWHACDGSTLASWRYPDFVAAVGVTMSTFTLPAQQRSNGGKYIIKLGNRRD